jgi:hypothetical protein
MRRVGAATNVEIDLGDARLPMCSETYGLGDGRWFVLFGAWEDRGAEGFHPVASRPPNVRERIDAVLRRRVPGGLVTLEICASGDFGEADFREAAARYLNWFVGVGSGLKGP